MPQIPVDSSNIVSFGFSAAISLYEKKMLFDTEQLTVYSGTSGIGRYNVLGISFQVKDQHGVIYTDFNFADPDIFPPANENSWEFDWSAFGLPFMLGNTLIITGGIKDENGTIYYTDPVYKKICKPNGLTEIGYVPGIFQIIPDCVNNVLTVKELSVLIYNKMLPSSVTKAGNLFYPTGADLTVPFTGTPFSNNTIVNGQYRIEDETVAEYDLGDDIYVLVTYVTRNQYNITCANFLGDISCCLTKNQQVATLNCGNAIGESAKQKTYEVLPAVVIGMLKQIDGQDASAEVAFIKKIMNCDCGVNSLGQNEMTPVNPAVTSIVLNGVGGTSIAAPTVDGNTKTYNILSKNYLVSKADTNDLAFTITADTSVTNQVNFKIAFNYNVQAGYILNAIAVNPTLIAQLNSFISSTGNVSLAGLNGKCIIDLSTVNLLLTQNITGATLITRVNTLTTSFNAPANLFANNPVAVAAWLNSLGIGTYTVTVNGNVLSILSLANVSSANTVEFALPDLTVPVQKTNKTLVNVLQAVIDYLCALTACNVALCQALTLYYFDYDGELTSVNFTTSQSQNDYNVGLQNVINNLAQRIDELTGITCAKIQAIFPDRPLSVIAGAARVYGIDQDANCTAFTQKQVALSVIQAINSYPDVKELFCAIDCELPGDCPDVANISLAMSGANIGIYGLTWVNAPQGTQTVTVRYKLNSSSTWLVSTNALQILPNGNISGSTPYVISGVVAGQTYDVQIFNNCGGVGFVKQITTPTGTVYSGNFIYDTSIYDICGNEPQTLYSSAPFGIGTIMYSNIALSVPLTGYNFIAGIDGAIYTIDSYTGEVLTNTLLNCNNGVLGRFILGNDTGTICDSIGTINLYTSGAFAVGKVLYTDSGLTSPQTGYSFAVNTANNHIYSINSVTGAVISDTGLTCGTYSGDFAISDDPETICEDVTTTLYSATAFAPGVTMYTNIGLTIPVTGSDYIRNSASGEIFNLNGITGVVGVLFDNC